MLAVDLGPAVQLICAVCYRVKKNRVLFKKAQTNGFFGFLGFIGFFSDKQEKIGKIIQKLNNLKP